MNVNKILGLVVLIVIVIIGVWWFSNFRLSKNDYKPGSTNNPAIQSYAPEQYPKEFPREVPIEAGAKIVSNYNATGANGALQASRVFESTKSVSANYDLYTNYLKNNGWKILTKVDEVTHKAIFAQKDSGILTVNISAGSKSGTSVVDISYVISK